MVGTSRVAPLHALAMIQNSRGNLEQLVEAKWLEQNRFGVKSILTSSRENMVDIVTILFHHVQRHSIFGIDDPDEEEAVTLNLIEGDVQNLLVVKSVIGDGHTSSWIS